MSGHAFFLFNLLQDVNVARPLVYMAARDFGAPVTLLVSQDFMHRDKLGIWRDEIEEMKAATEARLVVFEQDREAAFAMQGKTGVLVAASESSLPAHTLTHAVMLMAPPGIVKVTLQHGFECVGFLQSADHVLAHGLGVSFAADIICGWSQAARLTSLTPSQAQKLRVTGPPFLLQARRAAAAPAASRIGLVCENLHSVRLNVQGNFKTDFVGVFNAFCAAMDKEFREVALRPHPGGQYVLKNRVELPRNAIVNNAPIYKLDLSRFAYGISAPSSVILDMVTAGIPVAVWSDKQGLIDTGNYKGLATVSTLNDWIAFAQEATADPGPFLERQADFLERQLMPADPADIHARFAGVLGAALRPATRPAIVRSPRERIAFVTGNLSPTLQLSFLRPLAPMIERGEAVTEVITEADLQARAADIHDGTAGDWTERRLAQFKPTTIVFCRYSGPHAAQMLAWARRNGVPTVYQIDDDLLAIPQEIGLNKFLAHNEPRRLAAVRHLLDHVDLIYSSTRRLARRLGEYRVTAPVMTAGIYCAATVLRNAEKRPVRRIGYMASSDHAHNLTMIVPAIVRYLRRNPAVGFELFGTIPKPEELEEFGERITSARAVADYDSFLQAFAAREWDIGLCPLVPLPFNLMKANTKWAEYSSAGAAVIASAGTVYDESCADGCGILAETPNDWFNALQSLTRDPQQRFEMVTRAQAKLAACYAPEQLEI